MNVLPEVNLAPLPPITDEDLAIVPGTTCAMLRMIKGLTNASSMAEDYDFIGCDGRLVRIPASTRRLGAKLEGAAQAAYLLRLALTGDQRLALDAEDGLWVRLTDQWRPTSDILALTGEKAGATTSSSRPRSPRTPACLVSSWVSVSPTSRCCAPAGRSAPTTRCSRHHGR